MQDANLHHNFNFNPTLVRLEAAEAALKNKHLSVLFSENFGAVLSSMGDNVKTPGYDDFDYVKEQ